MTPGDELVLVELAARRLAKVDALPHRPLAEAETVAHVARAIRAREVRSVRARRTAIGLGLAAVAVVALGVGLSRRRAQVPPAVAASAGDPTAPVTSTVESFVGGAQLIRGGRVAVPAVGQSLAVGDELVARPGARLAFSLSTGTQLAVRPSEVGVRPDRTWDVPPPRVTRTDRSWSDSTAESDR